MLTVKVELIFFATFPFSRFKNRKITNYVYEIYYFIWNKVLVSGSDGEFVPINIEDIAEVVEVDEDGSTYRTFLKEGSTDPILGT